MKSIGIPLTTMLQSRVLNEMRQINSIRSNEAIWTVEKQQSAIKESQSNIKVVCRKQLSYKMYFANR